MELAKLALGTVQFGLDYGVTNQHGYISDENVKEILEEATKSGIEMFDTAARYGKAEERLGRFSGYQSNSHFVTKFKLPENGQKVSDNQIYKESLRKLQVSELHGVLFHDHADLEHDQFHDVVEILVSARQNGAIKKIGISVYDESELELAVRKFPQLDIIQLPANILDSKLLNSELVSTLKARNIEIHVRSVFLQGVLLADPESLPDFFKPLFPSLALIQHQAKSRGISAMELIVSAIKAHPHVDYMVFGATSPGEVREIHRASLIDIPDGLSIFDELPELAANLLDPRKWPKF